jgi:hypothetical protein
MTYECMYSMKTDFDVRAEFERWFSDEWGNAPSVEREKNGCYKLMLTESSWIAWLEAVERFVAWVPTEEDHQDEAIAAGVWSGA